MLVLGVVWGGSVVTQRLAVGEIDPLPLVALRLAAAAAFFLPFLARILRGLSRGPRLLADLALIGAVNPAPCGFLSAWALQYASSGVVAVLIALAPLLTALLATLLLEEPPPRRLQLAGLAVAFVGTALLVLTRSSGLGSTADGDLRGHVGALAIALLMAFATIYARRRLGGVDPLAAAAGQITGGLLFSIPPALLAGPVPLASVSVAAWASIVYSGAIGLSASFILFLGMIGRHGPTASLLALNVMPVAAALLGAVLLGEVLTPPMVVGASLVLLGVSLFTRG